MVRSCCVKGCSGDAGWKKTTSLSFFRVPAIITEKNKKFSGFGQDQRQKNVIELSKRRRSAWMKALKRDHLPDSQTIKVCARHFISGRPADLEDEDNPDWVPSKNLGYKTSKAGKTKLAIRKRQKLKLEERRNQAVECYGGSSDPPVFIETEEYEEVLLAKDASSPDQNLSANLKSSIETSENSNKNGKIPTNEGNSTNDTPINPNEKYGHWHVHFCTKKECLFSKAVAKAYSLETPDEEN